MPKILGQRFKGYEPLEKNEEWKQRRKALMQKYGRPALMGVQTARKRKQKYCKNKKEAKKKN